MRAERRRAWVGRALLLAGAGALLALEACVPVATPRDAAVDAAQPAGSNTVLGTGSFVGLAPAGSALSTRGGWDELIVLSSSADLCASVRVGRVDAGDWQVGMFATTTPAGLAVPAGVYELGRAGVIPGGTVRFAGSFERTDANCLPETVTPTAGLVVVQETGAGRVRGRFELSFATGRITGTFDAPRCVYADVPICVP